MILSTQCFSSQLLNVTASGKECTFHGATVSIRIQSCLRMLDVISSCSSKSAIPRGGEKNIYTLQHWAANCNVWEVRKDQFTFALQRFNLQLHGGVTLLLSQGTCMYPLIKIYIVLGSIYTYICMC